MPGGSRLQEISHQKQYLRSPRARKVGFVRNCPNLKLSCALNAAWRGASIALYKKIVGVGLLRPLVVMMAVGSWDVWAPCGSCMPTWCLCITPAPALVKTQFKKGECSERCAALPCECHKKPTGWELKSPGRPDERSVPHALRTSSFTRAVPGTPRNSS
jgi:hypothetical protein